MPIAEDNWIEKRRKQKEQHMITTNEINTVTGTIEQENRYTSGVYGKRQVAIVRGSGALLWDEEGREYIDCAAGHGVANIGHGRAEIAAALAAQAQRLITCPEIVYNDVRAQLLARLAEITPAGLSHFFLCNSGTEAVEGALKFARLATGRTEIVATLRGFHGRTLGALSATWEPHYREPFAPLLPGINHVRYNDLPALEAAVNEQTAAVLLELVQGEGGVHIATPEYIQGVVALCRERGVLLIIDEVQTGFGRTGHLFACEHYNLSPDILCLAKSLAGGLPMGAICLGERVMQSGRITRGVHGSTFGGNPLACAAALTTLDILEREHLPERAATLGAWAIERLRSLRNPLVRQVRGLGLMLGIELRQKAQPYLEALLARGILALPAGPNVIRLLPPLVITEAQLEHVIEVLGEVLGNQPNQSNQSSVGARAAAGTRGGPLWSPAVSPRDRADAVPSNEDEATQVNGQNGDVDGRPQGSPPIYPTAPAPTERNALSLGQAEDRANPEVALLYNMLTIPSYSGQEGPLAHFLAEQARQMGLHAQVDEAGNLVACLSLDVGEAEALSEPVILLGHMDTVRGNISVHIEDGRLYGRGAVDAKGPLAAFLCAAARLTRSGERDLQRPVLVIGAVEEEAATSRGARAVVGRYSPSACIIGEPSGSSAITIGYKGRLLVEYCVTRPLSHSAGPQSSSSEIATVFWEHVRTHADEWNRQHAGDSAFASLTPSLRNINSEQDGLEERTRLLIGYRLPPNYDIASLRSQLQSWAREQQEASSGDAISCTLAFSGEETAFQSTRTTPLARILSRAIRATGEQLTFKLKTGTSDMNVVGPVWGNNIVAYGPGDSRLDHTPQEHIVLSEYLHAIDVLEQALRELVLTPLSAPLQLQERGSTL
jgi:predicted acetylornithine/succinylornithine family transaminase/N-acetyl-ornithine/N-acetyl-lysine deacetylase